MRRAARGRARQAVNVVADLYVRQVRTAIREEVDRAIDATRAEVERLGRLIGEVEFRARRDIHAVGERDAALASARFAWEHMPTSPTFPEPLETLRYALTLVEKDGMVLEFGVYSGKTLRVIAEARDGKQVYGFDSWQGLPEAWRPNIGAGSFTAPEMPDVEGAELIDGWFEDSLPPFLETHPGPVAMVHIDCDLYSSTKTVLDHVGPRLQPGTVIVFDEYFNYPGWQDHEHKAWMEFVERTGIEFTWESYTSNDEQVVVRVTSLGPDGGPAGS
ncbi:class I SAM-dependent methyltransferase [Actinophytocola sp.]|uniref:class I SAM-dependent methyltransferase n=1 Tax=Actinophytocola sp. TaxID=1872138 RepID=UPI002D807612|nr:class I SAM-dependent methyltransferase [Actinophytocola sp.]HET9140597.1 class I SAM-dependent methyltransferase [Actinophytocola sp.]